jgi:hypothetical protein
VQISIVKFTEGIMNIENTDWEIWATPDGKHTWIRFYSIYEQRINCFYDDELELQTDELCSPEDFGHIFIDYV